MPKKKKKKKKEKKKEKNWTKFFIELLCVKIIYLNMNIFKYFFEGTICSEKHTQSHMCMFVKSPSFNVFKNLHCLIGNLKRKIIQKLKKF